MQKNERKSEVSNKLTGIISALERTFGVPEVDSFSEPLDELIFTVLSQNTNDRNRDRAWRNLKKRFTNYESILSSPQEVLEETIRVAGLAEQKSNTIIGILKKLNTDYNGLSLKFLRDYKTDEARRFLLSFKGVGPKTAACVLLFSLKKPAFPVDTHIFRVTKRLGIIPERLTPEKAGLFLETTITKSKFVSFHINLIRHGRAICHPQKPECKKCILQKYCIFFKNVINITDRKHKVR